MGEGITFTINAQTAQAAQQLESFFSNFSGGLDKINGLAARLPLIGQALTAALSLEALKGFVERTVEAEEELGRLSQRTGIAVQAVSGLQQAAFIAGVPFESLNVTLGLFASKMFTAAQEGGQANQAFRELGIRVTDVSGALRPTADVLGDVAEAFKNMADGPEKARLAMELFGRAGRELIPVLNGGRQAILDLANSPNAVTAAQAEAARKLGETWRQTTIEVRAAGRSFVDELAPALEAVSVGIGHVTSGLLHLPALFKAAFAEMSGHGLDDLTKKFGPPQASKDPLGDALKLTAGIGGFGTGTPGGAVAAAGLPAGTGAAAIQPTAEVRLKAQQALAAAEAKILDADLQTRAAKEKEAFDNGTITLTEYYVRRRQILVEGLANEKALIQGEIGRNEGLLPTAGANEKVELQAKQAELRAQLHEKEQAFAQAEIGMEDEKRSKQLATIREVQKQYAEAAQGKLALLQEEEAAELKQIDRTVVTPAPAVGAQKQFSQQQLELSLQSIETVRSSLLADTDISETERKVKLVALLQQELVSREKLIELAKTQQTQAVTPQARQEAVGRVQTLEVAQAQTSSTLAQTQAEELRLEVTKVYAQKRLAVEQEFEQKDLELSLEHIDAQKSLLSANTDISEAERKVKLVALLQQELVARQKLVDLARLQQTQALTPEARQEAAGRVQTLGGQQAQTSLTLGQTQSAGTFGGEFSRVFREMKDQSEAVAKTVADTFQNVIGSAIASISSGITGLIEGTRTWAQVLTQIGTNILNLVIQGIIEMGVKWVLTHVIMRAASAATHAAGEAQKAAQTATTISQQAAIAPALAINAANTSTTSYGAAAIIGIIAMVAALGIAIAAISGAFSEGGRPPVGKVALVGERGPELFVPDTHGTIIPAETTAEILRGAPNGGGGGGRGGRGAGAVNNQNNINLAFLKEEQLPGWANSQEGEAWFVRMQQKTMHRVQRG